jgi:DNA-binding transcriptional regulator YdaS (Cro superfamily)
MSASMSAIARAVEIAGGQQKLAHAIGVTQSQISHWINGQNVHHKHYRSIEAVTGVTAHELLADELEKVKPRKKVRRIVAA